SPCGGRKNTCLSPQERQRLWGDRRPLGAGEGGASGSELVVQFNCAGGGTARHPPDGERAISAFIGSRSMTHRQRRAWGNHAFIPALPCFPLPGRRDTCRSTGYSARA